MPWKTKSDGLFCPSRNVAFDISVNNQDICVAVHGTVYYVCELTVYKFVFFSKEIYVCNC